MDGTVYIDYDTIKKDGGHIYYWTLHEYFKPDEDGVLSVKTYYEVDCGVPRKFRWLSALSYEQSMGEGSPSATINPKQPKWDCPPLGSVQEQLTSLICECAGFTEDEKKIWKDTLRSH